MRAERRRPSLASLSFFFFESVRATRKGAFRIGCGVQQRNSGNGAPSGVASSDDLASSVVAVAAGAASAVVAAAAEASSGLAASALGASSFSAAAPSSFFSPSSGFLSLGWKACFSLCARVYGHK